MLIDTHCHLDAAVFDDDRNDVIRNAQKAGVNTIVIPAINRNNFTAVKHLAHEFPGGRYALGIHPMCVPKAHKDDLVELEKAIEQAIDDPRFVAIGEIGLDFFVPELRQADMHEKQEYFYIQQLKMAGRYQLPVLLHVRRSQDLLLKQLRRHSHVGGLAHAFNGSFQQAEHFIDQGFGLGFGGAMTFSRAKQIRRLAAKLPLDVLVLETDAPDIPPAWLEKGERNQPHHLARIAHELADLRQLDVEQLIEATNRNAVQFLPRLATLNDN